MITDLLQNGPLTSAQLSELTGTDRQKLRHQMDKLVAEGSVIKTVENRVAIFSLPVPSGTQAHEITMAATDVQQVLAGLRRNKARSVKGTAVRVGMKAAQVREALREAVRLGLAVRPFKRSERYVLA